MEKNTTTANPFESLKDNIISINRDAVQAILQDVINDYDISEILSNAVYPALNHVRETYRQRKTAIPEVLMSLSIVSDIIEKISAKSPVQQREQSVLIGVIEGDTHDMGKNIIRDVYRGYGFNVIDLGKNVTVDKFIETAALSKPEVVGLSSMMSTTLDKIGLAIESLRREVPQTKIMVGGAFMNQDLAMRLKADGYAESAATLIEETEKLVPAS